MNVWENAVVTDKGLSLLAKLTAGHTLDITRAETGAGYVTPGLLTKQTAVTDPKQALSFREITYPETGKCCMPCVLTNDEVETGYTANQVGIYATDPDDGEILFFIAQAAAEKGTEVPSATEMPGYSAEWTFYFQYGQADGVTVVVDPSNSVTHDGMVQYINSEIQTATIEEIDEVLGLYGGDTSGDSSGDGSSGTSGVGTLNHSLLYNRDAANSHPISAITGLEEALTDAEGTELDSVSIESVWDDVMAEETEE